MAARRVAALVLLLLASPARALAASDSPISDEAGSVHFSGLLVHLDMSAEEGQLSGQIAAIERVAAVSDAAQGEGDWTIVLRDIDWGELGRYPIVVEGDSLDERSLALLVPELPGTTCVHLEGPEGEVGWKPLPPG